MHSATLSMQEPDPIMQFSALICPQCGGALPRQAAWRMVCCPYCAATVTRSPSVVESRGFHEAWLRQRNRARERYTGAGRQIVWRQQSFLILKPIGQGEHSEVFLAERMDPFPERVVLKLARPTAPAGALAREAQTLKALQDIDGPTAPFHRPLLPEPIAWGELDDPTAPREILVLRHPTGYWGSLDQVLGYHSGGIDPRHGVWLWRRALDILAYVHQAGWRHGQLSPDHWLVHPRDHGVRLLGWSSAHPYASHEDQAMDLRQTAWALRWLLAGQQSANTTEPALPPRLPAPLADLLARCCAGHGATLAEGARGIDRQLQEAARAAFGPPRFIPFHPTAA